MPSFQPPFLRPSLPVGFLETVDLLPAYVQFCRRVPGCDFALCRFLTTDSMYFAVQSLHADGLPLEC